MMLVKLDGELDFCYYYLLVFGYSISKLCFDFLSFFGDVFYCFGDQDNWNLIVCIWQK